MSLKIVTFNVRYDKPDPEQQNWQVRRDAVASLLSHYSPDLIGTQEGKPHQLLDLHRLLPLYQSIGSDRTGTGTNEYCAIFYHSQRLKCLDGGDFALSETPDVPGSITPHWRNNHPRMVTWGLFEMIETPQKIILFNTHLDYKSDIARQLGANLIYQRLRELDLTDTYLFLTADFNASPGTLPRQTFEQPLSHNRQLLDILSGLPLQAQMTFNNFTDYAFDAIDTIYYDSRVHLKNVKIDKHRWGGLIPSDHFPVIGEFEINMISK